jgi:CxxC-x17-CxxC domain-containing protein
VRDGFRVADEATSGLDGPHILSAMSSGPQPGPTGRAPQSGTTDADPSPGGPVASTVMAFRAEEGLERVYQDRSLTCRDCAEEFLFSAGEQAFFATKGLTNDPQRCPSCRAIAKRARANEGPREFHVAICGACGGQAVVPFAPRNDRPVYCSSCFDKVRAGTLSNATVTA